MFKPQNPNKAYIKALSKVQWPQSLNEMFLDTEISFSDLMDIVQLRVHLHQYKKFYQALPAIIHEHVDEKAALSSFDATFHKKLHHYPALLLEKMLKNFRAHIFLQKIDGNWLTLCSWRDPSAQSCMPNSLKQSTFLKWLEVWLEETSVNQVQAPFNVFLYLPESLSPDFEKWSQHGSTAILERI